MNEALARLFAYAFQASGRKRLLEEDLVQFLALDRRFFTPSRVRSLVQVARSQGILRAAGQHAVEVSQEAQELPLALDYRPNALEIEAAVSGSPQAEPTLPLFRRIVRSIAAATQETESELVSAINRLQHEYGSVLTAEAAAFVFAGLRGVDVGPLGAELEKSFLRSHAAHGHK